MRNRALRLSARAKRKHPTERGTGLMRWTVRVLVAINDNRVWKRHPAPFAKHNAGRLRQAERHFRLSFKEIAS